LCQTRRAPLKQPEIFQHQDKEKYQILQRLMKSEKLHYIALQVKCDSIKDLETRWLDCMKDQWFYISPDEQQSQVDKEILFARHEDA
jgi:hypothetical protein